jgi:hypothetical protein
MLVLTAVTGQTVSSSDGVPVGRLIDLTARHSGAHARVHRLVVRSSRQRIHLVPWQEVATFDHRRVALRSAVDQLVVVEVESSQPLPLADDELLLVRDVLDTQIFDLSQHRIARVSNVLLDRAPDGHVDVVAVEIGFAAVLARLGLRQLGTRLPHHAIGWGDLHLTSDRGHASQLATSAAAVHRLDSRGLAELLTRLPVESGADVLTTVGPSRSAQALARTHPAVGHRLLRAMAPEEADRLVRAMPAEPATRYRRLISGESRRRPRYRRLQGWRLYRPPATRSHRDGT